MPLKPRSCLISRGHNRPSRDITRHHWAGIFSTDVFSHRGGLSIQSQTNAVHCPSVSTRAHIENLIICSFVVISMTIPNGSSKILWQRLNLQYYAVCIWMIFADYLLPGPAFYNFKSHHLTLGPPRWRVTMDHLHQFQGFITLCSVLCIFEDLLLFYAINKGSHPERKVQFFWTLFKRPLTPPPFVWTSCGEFFLKEF